MIRDNNTGHGLENLRRKADQHWDMAGLARADSDKKDEYRHTRLARIYEERIKDLRG